METKLEQMLLQANKLSAQYEAAHRFETDPEKDAIYNDDSIDTLEAILDKTKKAAKVDIENVKCKAHWELDRLIDEYGEIFMDTPVEEGKWQYTYIELQKLNIDELLQYTRNDAFWIVDFFKSAYNTVNEHLKEYAPHKYVNFKSVSTYKDTKAYIVNNIVEVLRLNKENEVHSNLIKVIKKVYDYYKSLKTTEDTIASKDTIASEETYLKQELLEEDPQTTKENIEFGIDNLIEYGIYHYYNANTAKEVLELVAMVVENGDTLQSIEGLTAEADWSTIIPAYYGIETTSSESDEDMFNELEPEDLPTMEVDLFDPEQVTKECLDDFIKRNRKSAGSASKQNNKAAITIKKIETNETKTFDSSDECAKFLNLNLSKRTMIRFKKGTTKLNKIWQVV